MLSRLQKFERRLAALHAAFGALSADDDRERARREHNELLAAMARAGLEHAGIDPNEAATLRHLEEPEPQPKPFVHPLRRLAEREKPRPLIDFLYDMTRRYHQGPAPNLRSASVLQLIGYYCFGDGCPRDMAPEALA
ncbi:MAG TPA: hypothetical protein VME45_22545 [Stellaceae bacterium]|nr:hypothetical protein [Stellaceae bacterium]